MKLSLLIASDNNAKIQGAKEAFLTYFPNSIIEIKGLKTDSNVPEQPFYEEILQGARNRLDFLVKNNDNEDIDYFLASEAGIIKIGDKHININLALIRDKSGYESVGISQGFMIPENLINDVRNQSLGKVLDNLFNAKDLNKKFGGIYNLSNGAINRIDLVKNSFVTALVPFLEKNKNIWK